MRGKERERGVDEKNNCIRKKWNLNHELRGSHTMVKSNLEKRKNVKLHESQSKNFRSGGVW